MIISVQSHVVYGYVGNKVAVYPLQSMGYDVCPINTVQFSNHTGYGKWQGDIFSADHIKNLIKGLNEIGVTKKCNAVLSGYMGSTYLCQALFDVVNELKQDNKDLLYLCDPVIGNQHCYVKPEVLDFFKTKLKADIVTPNQFEAETLSDQKINDLVSLKKVANYFHDRNISKVVITGIKIAEFKDDLLVFASDGTNYYAVKTKKYDAQFNGTGDLFSALYLGSYLYYRNIAKALQIAVYYTEQALNNTINSDQRELQVITVPYAKFSDSLSLPLTEYFKL